MGTTLARSIGADTIRSVALKPVCGVDKSAPVEQVIGKMVEGRTGCALVMGDGRMVGIFTERDFVSRVVAAGLEAAGTAVEQVMTPRPRVVSQNTSIQSAIEVMEAGGFRHLPVVDENGQPQGVLSVKAIVHYLVEYFPATVYNLPPQPNQVLPAREGA